MLTSPPPPVPCLVSIALLALTLLARLPAQTAPQIPGQLPPSTPGQPLTLNVNSRLVLEDILVFDRAGRPVFGLPASAFHVTDNGLPQRIRSFEEGSPTADAPSNPGLPLPLGTFRNVSNATDHTASEVLLINADSMRIEDQMYLLQDLQVSLATLPSGLEVAVFRAHSGRVVQIRGFGSDRADLRRALHECLPVLGQRVDDLFDSAVNQLLTVSSFLEQTPGRKNILWFAGAFPLVSIADQPHGSSASAREHTIHQLQEALAEARISVYPIDTRGVVALNTSVAPGQPSLTSGGPGAGANPTATSGIASTPTVLGPPANTITEQRRQMQDIASATGGRAYSLNHLSPEITEALELGVRAYTVSYTPTPYANDDSWHRVRVAVDPPPGSAGPYTLSYRPGYLATWTGISGGRVGLRLDPLRGKVLTGGPNSPAPATPLPFEVHIEPGIAAPGRKTTLPVTFYLTVPVDQLDFQQSGATWHNQIVLASYVYNADGRIRTGRMQQFDTTLSGAQWTAAQHSRFPLRQTLEIPRNADYLEIEMRDSGNHRVGSLMLSTRLIRALPGSPANAGQNGQSSGTLLPEPLR